MTALGCHDDYDGLSRRFLHRSNTADTTTTHSSSLATPAAPSPFSATPSLRIMASALKTIVSKNKRRHVEDGFNLDLSYISDRIIAMGFPAEKVESIYRNSLDEVKRFLEQKHSDHYFIYNLCSERIYDPKKFHGRVATYPFDDHHPPDFSTIQPFCKDVESWLSQDPKNVAVVHCKAGKGRTGVMICCYLLHTGRFKSAEEVLKFYGQQRTVDQKGVTIPSQRRYINYYGSVVRDRLQYKPVKLFLRSLVLDPVPNFNFNFSDFLVQFDVKQANQSKYESCDYQVRRSGRQVQLVLNPPLLVCGDVKIEFSSKLKLDLLPKTSRSKEFHFWFNTFFVERSFSSDLCHSVEACSPPLSADAVAGGAGGDNGHHPADISVTSATAAEDTLAASVVHTSNGGSGGLGLHGGPRFLGHMLRPSPPERHSSCVGGAAASTSTMDDDITNLLKHTSISDDHLIQGRSMDVAAVAGSSSTTTTFSNQSSNHHPPVKVVASVSSASSTSSTSSSSSTTATTQQSFNDRRTRHSSVPQTARSTGALPHVSHAIYYSSTSSGGGKSAQLQQQLSTPVPLNMPGSPVSMRLERSQIDKVAKDKTNKYPDNFQVTLFLFRPDDQSDAGTYSSSPSCLAASHKTDSEECSEGGSTGGRERSGRGHCSGESKSSPDSSSDDETTDSEAVSSSNQGRGDDGGNGVGGGGSNNDLLLMENRHLNHHQYQQQQQQQQQQQHSMATRTASSTGSFQSEWI